MQHISLSGFLLRISRLQPMRDVVIKSLLNQNDASGAQLWFMALLQCRHYDLHLT